MNDKENIDDEELFEISKILSDLVPEIRLQVFKKRAPQYFEEKTEKVEEISTEGDESEFFNKHRSEKRADNVHLIFAQDYSQFGNRLLKLKHFKEKGKKWRLKMPNDIGDTLSYSTTNNNKTYCFKKGKGYQLTIRGEDFVEKKFNVIRGNKEPPPEPEG